MQEKRIEFNMVYLIFYFRALGLPTSDLTYDDCKLMIRARQMNIPHFNDIVEIEKLRQRIGYASQTFTSCYSHNNIYDCYS